MQVMCFAIFAMGANLLMGSLGLLSLGQSAYFGLGGYVAGYLVQTIGLTPELGIFAGGLAGAALGPVFGWLVIRRQTIYFAMITLALAQIVYFFAVQDTGITGGENGIQGIPRGALFGRSAARITTWRCMRWWPSFSSPASCSCIASSIRPSDRSSKPSAKTSRAPSRSATKPNIINGSCLSWPPPSPALQAASKPR